MYFTALFKCTISILVTRPGDTARIVASIQLVKVVWQTSDAAGVEMIMTHVLEGN